MCPASTRHDKRKSLGHNRTSQLFETNHTMGLLDVFRGKKNAPQEEETPSTGELDLGQATSSSFDSVQGNTQELGHSLGGEFAETSSGGSFGGVDFESLGPPSERLYNPYEGIGAALDRRDVKAPFRLPKEPEFLFSEEAVAQRRSWSENLTYYTGVGYLIGATSGGGMGAYRAMATPLAVAGEGGMPSQRIRVNQLLNSSGKMGRSAGNSLGVLGLLFSSSESFYYHMNDARMPDDLMTVAAGATTGAIYRSVRGPRQAMAAAAVGGVAAALLLGGRKFISPGL